MKTHVDYDNGDDARRKFFEYMHKMLDEIERDQRTTHVFLMGVMGNDPDVIVSDNGDSISNAPIVFHHNGIDEMQSLIMINQITAHMAMAQAQKDQSATRQ